MRADRLWTALLVAVLAAGLAVLAAAWTPAVLEQRVALGVYGAGVALLLLSAGTDLYLSCLPYPLLLGGAWAAREALGELPGGWSPGPWAACALLLLWALAIAALAVTRRGARRV